MVAKKTAVQQSASGRSTGAGASGGAAEASGGVARASDEDVAPKTTATGKKKSAAKPAAKRTAEKTTAKKTTAKKTTAKKATAKSAAPSGESDSAVVGAGKVAAGKRTTKKATGTAKKADAAESGAGEKPTGRKSAVKKSVASAAEGAAEAAKTTGATTVVAKKTQGTATAAQKPGGVPKARESAVVPGELAVRPGEDPWTPDEVGEARAELQSEALRLGSEIEAAETGLAGLMRDSGDGAGDDEADTGTKNITREHEMALAANAREMLEQTQRALERLDAGTYGLCENCGNPIGKARMQAFPRATLCVECKQKQERRY
ncbi:TraR/DksA family transcriptional regulator [Streptomyces kunmingensis]|uniref:TraR/DksA family transcriptional regulator n=1 Tax=Streptomyces kunmingensis TaxID=68225 RepID=A0ABU6C908_9ACTN|nr:TraR/DksA family transcriptional regulator [Streptomyces kunmingensis]MEB3961123.1 TraR/DksA family transcriptional regulator [Streptomyces kunmingensis]